MHLSVRLEKATGICFLLFSSFSLLLSPDWGLVFEQADAAILRKSWSLSREVRVKRFSSAAWPFVSGHLWTAWSERRAQLSFCFCHSVQPKCLRHKQNGGDWLDAGFYFDYLAWGTVLFEIMQPWCSAILILNDESPQVGRNANLIALNISCFEKNVLTDSFVSKNVGL